MSGRQDNSDWGGYREGERTREGALGLGGIAASEAAQRSKLLPDEWKESHSYTWAQEKKRFVWQGTVKPRCGHTTVQRASSSQHHTRSETDWGRNIETRLQATVWSTGTQVHVKMGSLWDCVLYTLVLLLLLLLLLPLLLLLLLLVFTDSDRQIMSDSLFLREVKRKWSRTGAGRQMSSEIRFRAFCLY